MNFRSFLLVPILFFSPLTCFGFEIVTSITPLASLVKMLVQEHAEVKSIVVQGGCPHNHNSKAGDLNKVLSADMVIYIDSHFDSFAAKLMSKNKKILALSSNDNLTLITRTRGTNWHFWLDLNNVKVTLNYLAEFIIKEKPELEQQIKINLERSLEKIDLLIKAKNDISPSLKDIIVATDSMEYFFKDDKFKVTQVFGVDPASLKYLNLLKQIAKNKSQHCIILNIEQSAKIYDNLKLPYIKLDSENWEIKDEPLTDLFFNRYTDLIKEIREECTN